MADEDKGTLVFGLEETIRLAQEKAWDEGFDAGQDDQSNWDEDMLDPFYEPQENPYRKGDQ